jgi:hypothetical protein
MVRKALHGGSARAINARRGIEQVFGWINQWARLPLGSSSRWATAVQLRPSARQISTASCFGCDVNRRRVLVGLASDWSWMDSLRVMA